jgi:hypothetical protein
MTRRFALAALFVLVAALLPATASADGRLVPGVGVEEARAGRNGLQVGAAKLNITPFTIIPGTTDLVSPHSSRSASNPDGLPGAAWETFEPEIGAASSGQVLPTGVWGEAFTDQNDNARYDVGEPHVDDPVNTRLDPDSAGKWDGVYLAGFGSGRAAIGAFDPLWARALYVRDAASGLSYAQISIDFIGYFSDWNDRIVDLANELDPTLRLDHLIVSHTHNHEGPDMIGLWGPELDVPIDGTYPKYERYVELKIAQAVVAAAKGAGPARVRFGSMRPGQKYRTLRGNIEDLAGMQTRNSCRTPWLFDDEMRVAQFVRPGGGTIGTLVNWGTHVESLEDDNFFISSDYAHATRDTVEKALGGVAVFVNGAQGVVEIIGDSCLRRWQRDRFDGERFPVAKDGEPLVFDNMEKDPLGPRRRTYAIGRVFGNAAVAAVRTARFDTTATRISGFVAEELFIPINNQGLSALSLAGVIDKPAYIGGIEVVKDALTLAGIYRGGLGGVDARTTLYAWRIGSASFLTAPGELAPEIFWGLKDHHRGLATGRKNHYDYVRPNPAALECAKRPFSYGDTPGAHTGRPFEPGVRLAAARKYRTPHVFLLGYTPDLLGYIVPGYDFAWFAAPPADGVGLGALHGVPFDEGEAPDPCGDIPPDLAFPEARYRNHYQETNSGGSILAPAYACTVWEMLGLDPATSPEGGEACEDWHEWRNVAGLVHFGVDPAPLCNQSSSTDCVRHW